MIKMLKLFAATNRNLSIYDVVWLADCVEERRRAGFVNERDL